MSNNNPQTPFITPRDYLIALAIMHDGNWARIHEALKSRETVPADAIEKARNANAITYMDEGVYPEELQHAPRAPFVLFVRGEEGKPQSLLCDAWIQRNRKNWSEDEQLAQTDTIKMLVDCEASMVSIADGEHGPVIQMWRTVEGRRLCHELSPFPEGHIAAGNDYIVLKWICAVIAKDLFLFHLPQMGSGILDAMLHESYSSGVTYCLPHPFTDKDESNDFIASGCMPITRQTLESWMPSGRADA